MPSYAGIKRDWHRERAFVRRFEDMAVRRRRDRGFAAVVRADFAALVEMEPKTALDARVDAAFAALKRVDDHNALIRELAADGVFQSKVGRDINYESHRRCTRDWMVYVDRWMEMATFVDWLYLLLLLLLRLLLRLLLVW